LSNAAPSSKVTAGIGREPGLRVLQQLDRLGAAIGFAVRLRQRDVGGGVVGVLLQGLFENRHALLGLARVAQRPGLDAQQTEIVRIVGAAARAASTAALYFLAAMFASTR
jgi:hypothetical protein